MRDLRNALSLGVALPRELRTPITSQQARQMVERWQQHRAERFVSMLRTQVFANEDSVYRELALWAGLKFEDCAASVHRDGVEATLTVMFRAGVFVTLDEFKGVTPIMRGSRTFTPSPSAFRAPMAGTSARRAAVSGTTSGSTNTPRRVTYSWPFIADEAAHEQLLYEAHGERVARTSAVLWFPAPPGLAGIHNMLMDAKRGVPPHHWFSQLHPSETGSSSLGRAAPAAIAGLARAAGISLPQVMHAPLDEAYRVLDALPAEGILRGFASSVIRVAEEATKRGRSLAGTTLFTGGEPLTAERRRRIEASGADVYARFVATEAGVIGGSTPCRRHDDDMHIYTSRLAMIAEESVLYLTTFSTDADVVLLNTNLGDTGIVERRACNCLLGAVGLDTHVYDVRSVQRLTAEGMTVSVHEMGRAMANAWSSYGIPLDAVQIQPCAHDAVQSGLRLVIDPHCGPFDSRDLLASLYRELHAHPGALSLAAGVWKDANTLEIVRDRIVSSAGAKQPLYLAPRQTTEDGSDSRTP